MAAKMAAKKSKSSAIQWRRIAPRAISMYVAALVVAVSFLFVVGGIVFSNVASESAQSLSRYYSVETVAQFTAYTTPHLVLLQQVSNSVAVSHWFADEHNWALETRASYDIRRFVTARPFGQIHLVVRESSNEYSFSGSEPPDVLRPRRVLDAASYDDAWYFYALRSNAPFSLYISRCAYTGDELYVRMSQRVYSRGRNVGVVSVSAPFYSFYDNLSHGFTSDDMRGFIIDKDGNIRVDSNIRGLPTENSHPTLQNPMFTEQLTAFNMHIMNGAFPPGIQPEVLPIRYESIRFVSVVPIAGTDWLVVVLSGQGSLLNPGRYWPLMAGAVVVLIFSGIASYLIMRSLVLEPLSQLTTATTDLPIDGKTAHLAGSSRDDEIGVLARSIQDMHLRLSASNEELVSLMRERERQLALMESIDNVAFALLGMSDDNLDEFNNSLFKGIRIVSIVGEVSTMYIFKNEESHNKKQYVAQLAWQSGMPVSLEAIKTTYDYNATPGWYEKLSAGEVVNMSVEELSPDEQAHISSNARSILIVPVFFQERFWGTAWYEDDVHTGPFDEARVGLLKSAAIMMVSAVHRKGHVEVIREAADRQRLMLDAMPISCHIWDKNMNMIDANKVAVKFFGLNSNQELAEKFDSLSPEFQPNGRASKELAYEHIQKAFDEGSCEIEWLFRMPNTNEPIPTEIALLRVQYNSEFAVAAYIRDVREHRRMIQEIEHRGHLLYTVNSAASILLQAEMDEFESSLFRSLSMMARAVDVERVFLWEYKMHDNNKRYFNQIYEWVGVATVFGRQDHIIDYPEDIGGIESRLLRGLCVSGTSKDLPNDVREALILTGSKSYLMIPVFLRGKLWGVLGFGDLRNERSFSESDESILRSGGLLVANALLRYEMTQNIKATSTKLSAVISNYSGIIWSVDSDDTITLFNGLALFKLGIQSSFYEGKKITEIPENWHNFDILENVRKTFTEGNQRWTIRIRDDIFTARTSPVFDNQGNITDVVGSIDDITESYRLQEKLERALFDAQAASQAKSNFLSTMSHEMRTPMNAITGMCTIGKDADNIERKDYAFEKIEAASNHLLGVINDVLDMSKIEAGMLSLSNEPFDLTRIINRVITVIHFRIEEKNQHFEFNVASDVPSVLVADDHRLTQVLTNLLSNAVKFTPDDKSISLDVHMISKDEDECTIQFDVIDQGIGLTKEQQGMLFQSFVQAEASTTRKYGGTGLGLAISKHIVELMGGKIWIESELGKGATFSFTIHAKMPTDDDIAATQEDAMHTSVDTQYPGRKLLLAEDVDINREIVQAMLSESGIIIDCAENGEEALELFTKNHEKYDLIFMDVHMPKMDGYQTTRAIRALDIGKAKTIPIVALTANVFTEDIEKCMAAGMNAHLGKPLDFDAVRETLRKYLTKSKK